MTRSLVLLRHGRTAWNAERRIQGQLDAPLDDVGRAQARAVAPVVGALAPTLVWSSDLSRAQKTAEAVAGECGLAVRTDERLRETCLGDRQGITHDEYAERYPDEFERFRLGEWDGIPGGESTAEVGVRMLAVLGDVLAGLGAGETGVVVSHGAAIRIAVGTVLGWDPATVFTFRGLENCGWVHLVEVEPTGGDPWSGWRLLAYNRTAP
ncbi:histidine phosphatase family protein [Nocardioides sp. R-C-SC26]|uniref:histidine phosphatase family protein n=1 Tax=Nocardioides sp. R-C-SC26 TaxID=2870414 RepID=UPI001E2B090B|nr:histidine phosphatase family protein [Nocardioides sp. R-C-SC26]